MIIDIHVHCKISSIEYSKTCLIRHLFNPFPHVIRHFLPTLTVFMCVHVGLGRFQCTFMEIFTACFSSLKNARHAQLEMKLK